MTSDPQDDVFMRRALELALIGDARGGAPIGAILVLDNRIVAEGFNQVEHEADPTAHAEIVAMRALGKKLGKPDFRGATLYSTLQPCGMCTMASVWAKVSRIVYGAGSNDVHRMYFEDRHLRTLELLTDAYRNDMTIRGGVLKRECAALYNKPHDNVPLSEQANL